MPYCQDLHYYTDTTDDHSRTKLSFVDDEPGSDYINANYIPVRNRSAKITDYNVYTFLYVGLQNEKSLYCNARTIALYIR